MASGITGRRDPTVSGQPIFEIPCMQLEQVVVIVVKIQRAPLA